MRSTYKCVCYTRSVFFLENVVRHSPNCWKYRFFLVIVCLYCAELCSVNQTRECMSTRWRATICRLVSTVGTMPFPLIWRCAQTDKQYECFSFESTFYAAVFPLICDCITDFHWRIVPSVGVNCNLRDICTEQHSIEYEFMGACNTRCVCPERVIDHFRTVIENVELVCFFFLPLALRTKRAMQYMNEQLVEITDLEMESVPTIKENSKLCCCKSNNNDQDQQQKKQKYKNARWPMHTFWPKCISFHYYIEPGHTCNSNTFRWTTDWFTTAVFMLMVMLSSFVHVPPFVCVHCTFCIRLFFSTSFFCFDNYRCSFLLLLAI